jgi:hypothetical protein
MLSGIHCINRCEPLARQKRLVAILARGEQIMTGSPIEYKVHSQGRPENEYGINRTETGWTCTCAHLAATDGPCVHVLAVRFQNDTRGSLRARTQERPSCDRCKSESLSPMGSVTTRLAPFRPTSSGLAESCSLAIPEASGRPFEGCPRARPLRSRTLASRGRRTLPSSPRCRERGGPTPPLVERHGPGGLVPLGDPHQSEPEHGEPSRAHPEGEGRDVDPSR